MNLSSHALFPAVERGPRSEPSPVSRRRLHVRAAFKLWWSALIAALILGGALRVDAQIRGLPFIRTYPLEDIGYVPRSARLNFDSFGRLAVIHEGVYTVLNDTVWMNIAAADNGAEPAMINVMLGQDGKAYYGSRGTFGWAELEADGKLHAFPHVPTKIPDWLRTSAFSDFFATKQGMFFLSWNGLAYLDYATQQSRLFKLDGFSRMFALGSTTYLYGLGQPLRTIDVGQEKIDTVDVPDLGPGGIEWAVALNETRALLALRDGRHVIFDGQKLEPWPPQARYELSGRVSALTRLVDGRIAIAITGRGLFLFTSTGEVTLALTTPEYFRINELASREPGVLWVATEDAIQKVLYASPLTTFGQKLGLMLGWPIVEHWNGRTFVASEGNLYEAIPGAPGAPSRFELLPEQPPGGAWSLTASGSRLLVGSAKGVFAPDDQLHFEKVAEVEELTHLALIDPDHCYAIGHKEIAFLENKDGRWVDATQRLPGLASASMIHRVGGSVWIEMGGDGAARIYRQDGHLKVLTLKNEEWTHARWANLGSVDNIVVLSGSIGERRFFDESTGKWCDAPVLRALLARSPFWIARVQKDGTGTIWATHNDGLVRFSPRGNDYEMDASSFDVVNDRWPLVRVLGRNDVWLSTAQSLSHVENVPAITATPLVKMVSVVDAGDSHELMLKSRVPRGPLRLSFTRNTMTFRFYSGSDNWRRPPVYEYRMDDREAWTPVVGSSFTFRGLREGSYRFQVRLAGKPETAGASSVLAFEILPPWYRTRVAYLLFGLATLAALVGVVAWLSYAARKRSRLLEKVVDERTGQLQTAMEKLNVETRNAATREERDRLASEIHDSLQQGLTGAILQLDTTLRLAAVVDEVRSRLHVVRNMISYARQEVQHAVWDMESPLLEGTELGDALRNLTAFVESQSVLIDVTVSGLTVPLTRGANHNLLRIAQEATTNAVRHAQAKRITIRLEYEPDGVALEVADDGIGFLPDLVLGKQVGHFGLRGIRTRAKKLRADLSIQSVPGKGTTIRVRVPTALNSDLQPHVERSHW